MSSQSNNDGSYTLDVTFAVGTDVEHGPGAGAEPRRHRPADAARRGQGHRRDRQEAVSGHSADRQSVFRHQSRHRPAVLRPALPEQLRDHQSPGYAGRDRGRGRRLLVRRAGLQHAGVARPGQAAIAEPDGRRRDPRPPRAERAGGGRADRPAAGPPGPGLPVHHEHPRPAGRARTVRRHHSQDRRGRRGHLPQGRGPRTELGAKNQDQQPDAGRQAGGGPGDLPVAGVQRPGRGRPHQGQDARVWKSASPRASITPSSTTPRPSSANPWTRSSIRCATR